MGYSPVAPTRYGCMRDLVYQMGPVGHISQLTADLEC